MTTVWRRQDEAQRVTQRAQAGVPQWAWIAAGCFVAASLAVFAIGRGGTAVLLGTVLALAALACISLSEPDGDPAEGD